MMKFNVSILSKLKGKVRSEIFLSEDFMKYSFRVISWNLKYFHEILMTREAVSCDEVFHWTKFLAFES